MKLNLRWCGHFSIDFTHLRFRRHRGSFDQLHGDTAIDIDFSYQPTYLFPPVFHPPAYAYWVRDNLWALCVTSDATFTGIFRPHLTHPERLTFTQTVTHSSRVWRPREPNPRNPRHQMDVSVTGRMLFFVPSSLWHI